MRGEWVPPETYIQQLWTGFAAQLMKANSLPPSTRCYLEI